MEKEISKKQWMTLIAVVVVVGLLAGFVGNFINSAITGQAITHYRNAVWIHPSENIRVDSWFPWREGNVYLTGDSSKSGGGLIVRTRNPQNLGYNTLASIDKQGNMKIEGDLGVKKIFYKGDTIDNFIADQIYDSIYNLFFAQKNCVLTTPYLYINQADNLIEVNGADVCRSWNEEHGEERAPKKECVIARKIALMEKQR